MRRITLGMAQKKPMFLNGQSLFAEDCFGGYFSTLPDYGLRVEGATLQDGTPTPDSPVQIQCVKAGTKIRTCGRNIFNKAAQAYAYSGNVGGGYFITGISATDALRAYIVPVVGGETYTLSGQGFSGLSGNVLRLSFFDYYPELRQTGYASVTRGNNTRITAPSNAKYMLLGITLNGGDLDLIINTLMVSRDVGEYEPYIGNEITVPCDLYDGDVWYPMTGVVERHTCISALPKYSANVWWGDWANGRMYKGIDDFGNYSYPFVGKTLCTHFGYSVGIDLQIPHFSLSKISHTAGSQCIYLCLPGILSEEMTITEKREALNAFLAQEESKGTPVMVSWRRAEPLIEYYDPQPIFAPQGTVNVTQSPTDLPAQLSATMMVRR